MRSVTNWNDNWEFGMGDEAAQVTWSPVQLPHTWNALDGQDGGADYVQAPAYYRKKYLYDAGAAEVYLRFHAVSKKAEVWCNGHFVGAHEGGFSAFTLELTPYLAAGANEILVKADNSKELPIYPMVADFTFFGGIYRDVELLEFDSDAHLDVCTYGTDGVFVTPQKDGSVRVDAEVKASCLLKACILDADGRQVAEAMCDAHAGRNRMELKVDAPHAWQAIEDPYLYTLQLECAEAADPAKCVGDAAEVRHRSGVDSADPCCEDGSSVCTDHVTIRFGFRTFRVDAEQGFYLNDASYPLHGVCRHQDREDRGWAISRADMEEDMALIREIGANTIRLAHYQHAEDFYDLCDEHGLVAWAEIPFISVHDTRPEADENLRSQLRELICQNYNHPAICFWGIANEIGITGESAESYQMTRELHEMAKKLDPTRLTAIANVGMTQPESELFHITDVTTYNEYMGWYEGSADDHGSFCDERHHRLTGVPMGISEYGADAVLSWHSEDPKCKDYTEEYQAIVHEKAQSAFAQRPYLWATWLWNMFDFAADARDEGGCRGRNNKGLVTFDRKVKKQAFYYYKAQWSKEPFVYLCGKRFTKRAGEMTCVKVYSNCQEVHLTVNGAEVAGCAEDGIFRFEVQLQEGMNHLIARTEQGCEDTLDLCKVAEAPKEYTYVEEKEMSDHVKQWFAGLEGNIPQEITVREGYLSVYDPLEEVYRYEEGYRAVQELIRQPLSIDHPAMAARMETGGPMSFHSIWSHISRMLPDAAYYALNERLSQIRK